MASHQSIHLTRDAFAGATVVGTGGQMRSVVSCVDELRPHLIWWVADTSFVGPSALPRTGPDPVQLGPADALLALLEGVEQFDSAVFLGVDGVLVTPRFRDGGVWTDDSAGADLGDAIVEIRVFDYTWFEITSADTALLRGIAKAFHRGSLSDV